MVATRGRQRAAVYVRVSTEEQARDGYSCEAQRRECAAFCARQGWDVVDVYADEGYSAKSMARPAVRRLLADARAGTLDVVVVWKLDRFSRRQLDTLRAIREDLEPRGIGFRSATQDFDTTSSAGRAMLGMLAVFAELEREQLSERTRSGLAETARQGRWASGVPPYGYRLADGALLPDPDRAAVVRLIFDLYAGGTGYPRIREELDRRRVPTPAGRTASPGAAAWRTNSVANILANRAYLGEVRMLGQWVPGLHAPIVDREVFDRAAAIRQGRAPGHREHRSGGMLAGILACGACGASWYYRYTSAPYYVCARRPRRECSVRPARADHLDAEVLSRIVELGADDGLLGAALARQVSSAADLGVELQRLDRAAADADRRIAFWLRAAEDGEDLAEARERVRALRAEREAAVGRRDAVRAEIAALDSRRAAQADLGRMLRRLSRDLPRMSPEDRRAGVRATVSRVVVAPDHTLRMWFADGSAPGD